MKIQIFEGGQSHEYVHNLNYNNKFIIQYAYEYYISKN